MNQGRRNKISRVFLSGPLNQFVFAGCEMVPTPKKQGTPLRRDRGMWRMNNWIRAFQIVRSPSPECLGVS